MKNQPTQYSGSALNRYFFTKDYAFVYPKSGKEAIVRNGILQSGIDGALKCLYCTFSKSFKNFLLVLICTLFFAVCGYAQKPRNGVYKYSVAFDEWGGKSLGATCLVRIKGDSIYVINDGSLTGEKGEIMDAGIIMKHKPTGKWIIGRTANDTTKKLQACGDGPSVIDFKKKRWWTC